MVVLALPAGQIPRVLESIASSLPEGCVVVDTASLKGPTLEWVASHMPEGRYYVGAIPVAASARLHVGSPEVGTPRADLFSGGLLGLVIPPGAPQDVVDLVLSMVALLGASPFFLDAAEADLVTATVEGLPALLGLALMRVAHERPGWHEVRRLAGRPFASAAIVGALQPAEAMSSALTLNRANVLAKLDAILEELGEMRRLIATAEDQELTRRLAGAIEAHDQWLAARMRGDWSAEEVPVFETPERRGIIDRMFGIGPRDRKGGA
jgi:prephenate dehydrogenase